TSLAKSIENALNDPTFFGANSVVVTPPSAAPFTSFVITFRGPLANANVAQITGTGVTLPAGVTAANYVIGTTPFDGVGNEVQTLQFNNIVTGNGAGGKVLLSYNGVSPPKVTDPLTLQLVDQLLTWIPSSTTTTPIADTAPASPTAIQVQDYL